MHENATQKDVVEWDEEESEEEALHRVPANCSFSDAEKQPTRLILLK